MTSKLKDAAAFPIIDEAPGMTYRQWLAGMALQGILANPEPVEIAADDRAVGRDVYKINVEIAVKYADALIAVLEKEQS